MKSYWCIYPHDAQKAPLILHYLDKRILVRKSYQDLVCSNCGKIAERTALKRGIENDVNFKTRRDLFCSADGLYVVSKHLQDALLAIPNVAIDFFSVPSCPTYFVALPKNVIYPKADDPAFRTYYPCSGCHRFRGVYWGPQSPKIYSDIDLGMFHFEEATGLSSIWFVSEEYVKDLISNPNMSGLFVDKSRTIECVV
jgi:hypothetical protein